jgi:hypothetical protein
MRVADHVDKFTKDLFKNNFRVFAKISRRKLRSYF